MRRKLPPESFAYYLGLGVSRSYAAVAQHFDVNTRTVTALAKRERWQEKLRESERQARAKAEERAQESIEEMTERQLKMVKFAERKLLESLQAAPIGSGPQAVRALLSTIDKERELRAGPEEDGGMSPQDYAARVRAAMAAIRTMHGE